MTEPKKKTVIIRNTLVLSFFIWTAACVLFWYLFLTFAPTYFVDSHLFGEGGRLPNRVVATAWRADKDNEVAHRSGVINTPFFLIEFSQSKELDGSAIIRLVEDNTVIKHYRIVVLSVIVIFVSSVLTTALCSILHRKRVVQ